MFRQKVNDNKSEANAAPHYVLAKAERANVQEQLNCRHN